MPGPPRPTHFLSFPLSSSPQLSQKAIEISKTLLEAVPLPTGIDESLFVDPRSLHLTLGIMSLRNGPSDPSCSLSSRANDINLKGRDIGKKGEGAMMKTVDEAISLLRSCQTGIRSLLSSEGGEARPRGSGGVQVHFDNVATFQSDPTKVRVLYAEPRRGDTGTEALLEVADYIRERFEWEGMLADKDQPLTLHCTLAKASNRKNRPKKPARPADYIFPKKPDEVVCDNSESGEAEDEAQHDDDDSKQEPKEQSKITDSPQESSAFQEDVNRLARLDENAPPLSTSVAMTDSTPDPSKPKKKRRTRPVRIPKKVPFDASLVLNPPPSSSSALLEETYPSLGSCVVDCVELCEMGRRDKEGRYVALARIQL